ncbi:MAG: ATP-binding cassette domain-containing protein [Salinivirgaceae bacterium]|nr:ATP-binding cassette domain-containing protein [Salinivirgaceae bacterium]
MEIQLSNISLAYTGTLLDNPTPLILNLGKNYIITSPSGTGKSTLIHLIYGLVRDYEGDYTLNNKETRTLTIEEWSQLRTSVLSIVFQGFRLIMESTVLENIVLKNKLTSHVNLDEIEFYASQLNIETLLNKKVSELSFGQQQRVAILRSLCQPFKWLLLDEPFAHLDRENMQKALTLLTEKAQQNGAGIIISDTKTNLMLSNFIPIQLNTLNNG